MDKQTLINFLTDFLVSPMLSKKCKSLVKWLIRKAKRTDDLSVCQFVELIGLFCDEIMLKESDDQSTSDDMEPIIYSDTDDIPEEIKDIIKGIESKYGSSNIEVKEIPYPSNFKNGKNIKAIDVAIRDNEPNANWIKRRALLMDISSREVIISESFMDYLEEIRDSANIMSQIIMTDDDDKDDDDSVNVLLGTLDNNITLTMVGGVSEYETFHFSRNDKDLGLLDPYDFNYFNKKTGGKLIGKYLFQLDSKQHLFLGKKIG